MHIPAFRYLPLVVALSSIVSLASSVTAQTSPATTTNQPTFDVSAGYQFLHAPDQNFPVGFNLDGSRQFGKLGLVAELGASMDSDEEVGFDVDTTMWHFGAGPRWTGFGSGRLWPYGQLMLGAAIARTSVEVAGVDSSDSESVFMVQPGVGVTCVVGDGWGVFGQADYRRTFFDEPDDVDTSFNNQFRVVVGVRMILD